MEKAKDRDGIAKFIHGRFHDIYIQPFENNQKKNGFIMMASACLMIEALESFWNGWRKSPNSPLAFCQFFDREARFSPFRGLAQEFYSHVRCGIFHQAETTGGWHIRRDLGVLLDADQNHRRNGFSKGNMAMTIAPASTQPFGKAWNGRNSERKCKLSV